MTEQNHTDTPNPTTITGSQVGVVGDHAHIEGGIHFHSPFARLNHWRTQHPWRFYPALLLAFLLVLILGVAIAGAISPDIRQRLLLQGFWPRAFPKEREDEILIIIATFHYAENLPSAESYNEIKRSIEKVRDELNFSNLRVQVEPTCLVADDHAGARSLGNRYDASIVIWGEETSTRVTVNFFNRKQAHFVASDVNISQVKGLKAVPPSEYATFITKDLPGQLTFLSLYALGQSYYAERAYAESAQVIGKAVAMLEEEETVKGSADAYFRLGWLYQVPLEDLDQALFDYTRAIELDPDMAVAYNNRGLVYNHLSEYAQAEADFNRAIELDPNAVRYNNRGVNYNDMGQYDQALADYDRAIEFNPLYAQAYNNRGVTYHDMGEYDQALADYTRAIEINPQYVKAYNNRGINYNDMGEYDQALADYNRAIEIKPTGAEAYNNLGITYYELGDTQQAIANYDRAIELTPDFALPYYNRGIVYQELKDYQQAIADYDRAIQLDPRDTKPYYNQGNTYYKMHEYERAIESYGQAIELNPQYAKAYYSRGNAYRILENYQQAIADYDRAIDLNPQFGQAYNNRGLVYKTLQDYPQATQDYTRAAELLTLPLIYDNLAQVYALQNQPAKACAWLEKAIARDAQYQRRARVSTDFDLIRDDPCFQALLNDE